MDPVTITGLVVLFGVGIGGVVAGAASDAPEDSKVKRALRRLSFSRKHPDAKTA